MTDLATRYGTRRPLRRGLTLAATLTLAGVALGWLTWVIAFHGRPLASSELVSFEVTGPHAAQARVAVERRTAEVEASCLLRAYSSDHAIVGELDFTVDSSEPETTTLRQSMRTERTATSVELVGCLAEGQTQRR